MNVSLITHSATRVQENLCARNKIQSNSEQTVFWSINFKIEKKTNVYGWPYYTVFFVVVVIVAEKTTQTMCVLL